MEEGEGEVWGEEALKEGLREMRRLHVREGKARGREKRQGVMWELAFCAELIV